MKYITLGSHYSLVDLMAFIQTRWGWDSPCATDHGPNTWLVTVNGRVIDGVRVIKQNKRYKFQREVT